MLITQEGTYRGEIVSGGLAKSSGELPEERLDLKATEVWDTDSQEWLSADPENNEIRAFLQLFSHTDKELLHNKQLKKVVGDYNGDFRVLAEMVLAGTPIQFRVEPNTYNDNTTLKVTWIDIYDAVPGKTLGILDKEGVAALQQRYATVLASTKTPVKAVSAASAPVSAPKTAPPQDTDKPITGDKGTPVTKTKGKPKGRPAVPGKTAPISAVSVGKCTPDEAWDACISLKRDDITEEKLTEIWTEEVYKVNKDPDALTPEQWYQVKVAVQKLTSKV